MRKSAPRRGYALVLVLLFTTLLLSMASMAYRHVGAALRVESTRVNHVDRDEGTVQAMAVALARLETGMPPADPYICSVTVETSSGTRTFTITMTMLTNVEWSVTSAPADPDDVPDPILPTFAL